MKQIKRVDDTVRVLSSGYFFCQNIGWVTPQKQQKGPKKIYSGSKYPKQIFNLILKTEALVLSNDSQVARGLTQRKRL